MAHSIIFLGPRDPPPIGRSEERPSIGRAMPAPTREGGCANGIDSTRMQKALAASRSIWVFLEPGRLRTKPPVLGVGLSWISLDSLVRIETFQWVTRDLSRFFFRYAFSLTLQSPRQALVVLGFGSAGLVMEQA
jgi:hypothetical protein